MKERKEKTASLKVQSAWLLFAKIVGFGFSFLLPLMIVRFLSKEEVGIYRQTFLIIANANIIFSLGFGMSAYYYLPRENERRRSSAIFHTLIFNFAIGGLVCLVLFLFPSLVGNIFQSAEITGLAPKIGIVVWLWIFSGFLEIVAVANQEPKTATAFIVLAQFTKTALMLLAVVLFANVESFVYAAIAQGALQSIILLIYLNSRFPRFWTALDAKFFREQLFYALPFGLSALMWTLQTDVHNYFVSYRFSTAEFAIYSVGCFQLPLVGLLGESVASVLIPRISQLQASGDRAEIIRLTMRAAQKLAFFYFPLYVFLMITAQTFITTLFTRDYAASVPIFLINLTLLPIWIWVLDPIVRAYKELGRYLLPLRAFIFLTMLAALYYGIQHFDLREMILIVIISALAEKFIFSFIIVRKLNVGKRDLQGLKELGKTAVACLSAGILTFLFYRSFGDWIFAEGARLAETIFDAPKPSLVDFTAGNLVLALSALVFAPVYLFIADRFGVIEQSEREKIKAALGRLSLRRNKPKNLSANEYNEAG